MVDPESKALITDAVLPTASEIDAVADLDTEEEHITLHQVFVFVVCGLCLGVAGALLLHLLFRYWLFR
jgi:H+/Cl- antiporter ClcA